MAPDRIGNFVQEDTGRIEDAETADGGDVLGDDVFGLGARMKKASDIADGHLSRLRFTGAICLRRL